VESCGKEAERRVRMAEAREEAALRARGWVSARYGGECASCGTGFGPGELIGWDDTATGWRARCCA
jgi:hypothetical protein